MIMDKILYPNHPVRCIITGPSNFGKSVFLTNSILNFINESDKILPKRTIRANGNIYHIFKPNNFRDVQRYVQIKFHWM